MNYRLVGRLVIVALALLFGGVFAHGASAQIANPGPVDVVRAFYGALNARDFDKARSLVVPGLQFEYDTRTDLELMQTLEDQIPGIKDHNAHFTILKIQAIDANTVSLQIQIDANDLAELHLAHPYTSDDIATVKDGKITAYTGTTTQQTKDDLAAASGSETPGMPKTGASDVIALAALVASAVLELLLGLRVKSHLEEQD
jgi:hypothetical protein